MCALDCNVHTHVHVHVYVCGIIIAVAMAQRRRPSRLARRCKGGAMQAAARLKGAMTTVSASPKSPVEVSAAAVDAARIATSRRMLLILWQFSRLAAAAALKFSTIAPIAFELLAPSCLSRTSSIERSPAPCCSSQSCALLACLLQQRCRFCSATSRRCALRDAERAAREPRRRPASRERQAARGLHAAHHCDRI